MEKTLMTRLRLVLVSLVHVRRRSSLMSKKKCVGNNYNHNNNNSNNINNDINNNIVYNQMTNVKK